MKQRKKIIVTLVVLLSINFGLFAQTTIVNASYYDDGPNPLFNDIYSSLMVTGTYMNPLFASQSEDLTKIGANYNGSVFFKDFPVGMYYALDFVPMEADIYMGDFIFGIASRNKTSDLTESYFNIGPAISVVMQDEDAFAVPYTLIYWGGAINAGYRFAASKELKALTIDVGATAKAYWYDSENSVNTTFLSVNDTRYAFNAYIGITYRWFAPDFGENTNIIIL